MKTKTNVFYAHTHGNIEISDEPIQFDAIRKRWPKPNLIIIANGGDMPIFTNGIIECVEECDIVVIDIDSEYISSLVFRYITAAFTYLRPVYALVESFSKFTFKEVIGVKKISNKEDEPKYAKFKLGEILS